MRMPWLCLAGVLMVMSAVPAMSASHEKVMIEWKFDKEGEFQGWSPNGHITEVGVTGGVLTGTAMGRDPILTGPVFDIKATPTQYVEIKMRATDSAPAELFWTNTLEGKYGGFGAEKHNLFYSFDDDQFHIYRICPFWQAAKKIIRLRLDPPNTGNFEIEWIRIVEDNSVPKSEAKAWTFDTGAKGWRAWQDVSEPAVKDGCLEVTATGKDPIIMSPLLAVPADENPFVSIRMATESGTTGRIYCVSSGQFGWEDMTFNIHPDGKVHSYNIDVGSLRKWRDTILMLAVQPTNVAGGTVRIRSIEIANAPCGPTELSIRYFGKANAVNRAGRPVDVTCSIRNLGGDAAQNVAAVLSVPKGVTILGDAQKKIEKVSIYLAKPANWQIHCPEPGKYEISVQVEAPGHEPIVSTATIELTKAPDVPKTGYVPVPLPVESKYEVGVYYFPGWCSMARWQPILDYPERKPVLGWYDEANPECADWQIKWAVEHGISFFMVDWYWCQGGRHLEHWIHNAYMKAKYRKYLKWAVMWANHNSPNTHSLDDWRAVTQYWLDNYLHMDEYYCIDGRPAIFIWSPSNIRRDIGGSQEAAKLYALSQKMARDAGLKGIYFVAMSSHETDAQVEELKSEGYEGFTSYHGFRIAMIRAGGKHFPFADVVETSPELWKAREERAHGLLQLPIVDTGWASQPWHGNKSMVITGRTPELFGKLCREGAAFDHEMGKKIVAVGPWNEWGEGSYIEPYAEYGFQDLDQLRSAFCEPGDYPPNLIPSDVGLGPYDLPAMDRKTSWEFNTEGDTEGWMPTGQKAEVKGGVLAGESFSRDPVISGPGIQIEAERYKRLVIRMSSSEEDRPQMFWATTLSRHCEKNSVRFDVPGDGQMHEVSIDLSKEPQWRGVITSLRFDPANKPGVKFAIDYIRLLEE